MIFLRVKHWQEQYQYGCPTHALWDGMYASLLALPSMCPLLWVIRQWSIFEAILRVAIFPYVARMIYLLDEWVPSHEYRHCSHYGFWTTECTVIYSRMQPLDIPQWDTAVSRLWLLQGFCCAQEDHNWDWTPIPQITQPPKGGITERNRHRDSVLHISL